MDIRVSKDLVGIVEFLEYLATLDKAVTRGLKEVLVTLVLKDQKESLDTQESQAIQELKELLDTVVMKVLQGTPDYLDILVTKETQETQDIRVSLVIRDQRE